MPVPLVVALFLAEVVAENIAGEVTGQVAEDVAGQLSGLVVEEISGQVVGQVAEQLAEGRDGDCLESRQSQQLEQTVDLPEAQVQGFGQGLSLNQPAACDCVPAATRGSWTGMEREGQPALGG